MIINDQPTIFKKDRLLCVFSSKSDYFLSPRRRSVTAFRQDCQKAFGSIADGVKHYYLMRTDYEDAGWQFDEYVVVRSEKLVNGSPASQDGDIWTNAIITDSRNLALCLSTADCLPVTLYDPEHHVIALAHLGWQATTQHLLDRVLEGMSEEFASRPADIKVSIGPSIKKESYVFDNPEQSKLSQWKRFLQLTAGGYGIDLVGYNLNQLTENSINPSDIQVSPIDTALSDDYESHYLHTKKGLPRARRFLNVSMLL